MTAHWEHGYRVHGYWDDETDKRLGAVGLTPPRSRNRMYTAYLDSNHSEEWQYKTLRAAKKRVEREVARALGVEVKELRE